ncbi:MAG: ABC transporter permease [Candidatus Zixiibacteriota bacterium]
MQRLLSIIGSSIRDIFAHKLRILLTSLGVIIGVIAVVGMSTAAYSLQQNIIRQVESLGADTFYIVKTSIHMMFNFGNNKSDYIKAFKRPPLELSYEDFLRKNVPAAKKVIPKLSYQQPISSENKAGGRPSSILATNEQMLGINNLELAYGRFFSKFDVDNRRPVCIIGQSLITEFFSGRDPIGEKIKLGGIPFNIVGVFDSINTMQNDLNNRSVVIPISTGVKYFKNVWDLQYIVQAKPEKLQLAIDQSINTLRNLRGLKYIEENNFDYFTSNMLLSHIGKFTTIAYFVLLSISAISLFVAGIGIMNVMYVTVSERTKEIGIRKSVGAFKKDIIIQFTTEAVLISLFGGLIGIGIIKAIVMILQNMQEKIKVIIYLPTEIIVLGLVFSFIVGVFFGIMPALKASKLNIVEALRK